MTTLFARQAALPSGIARDVTLEIEDGRFTAVRAGSARPPGADELPGVVLPGFANHHSHAFHRALRGRTHNHGGTFWTWRESMYVLAARLDPDSYLELARATFAELVLAGFTSVGEFHYLHHDQDGHPYADPNAMGHALHQAARDAGLRMTLLDTCYLAGGLDAHGHRPVEGVQRRFADASGEAWAERVAGIAPAPGVVVGAAIHSVRAVPRDDLPTVVRAASGRPLHAHVSEQPAENAACLGHYGATPTQLLDAAGALTERTTVVHATHVSAPDIAILGRAGATACLCPTTEQDLADGIGPARKLADAGIRIVLGSDQHALIDPFTEARALEAGERVTSLQRGRFRPDELLATVCDHAPLGWPDAGAIEVGRRADLVAVRTDSVRTAGSAPDQLLLTASAADVDTVFVDGVRVVSGGQHRLGDVGRLLQGAIDALWPA